MLPAIDPAGAPNSLPARSPYRTSLVNVVLHFNTSPERLAILEGFLNFRAVLHKLGLVKGFQWLDGSMLEEIEKLESRAPNDVDVVTFYWLPAGKSQADVFAAAAGSLTDTKAKYRVDAYLVDLAGQAETLVSQSRYWYSMWSHRRNGLWKGYLEVDLDPADDAAARKNLTINAGGARP